MAQEKIIICSGDAHTPARFWSWAVCEKDELTEEMKKNGWGESYTTKYLSNEQIDYLNGKENEA